MLETTKQTIETIIDTLAENDLFKERFIFADGREYSSDKPETGEYVELKTPNDIIYYDRGPVEIPKNIEKCHIFFQALSTEVNVNDREHIYSLINDRLSAFEKHYYIFNYFAFDTTIGDQDFRIIKLFPVDLTPEKRKRNIELLNKLVDYFYEKDLFCTDDAMYTNGHQYSYKNNIYVSGPTRREPGIPMHTDLGNVYYDRGLNNNMNYDPYSNPETITIYLYALVDLCYAMCGTEEAKMYEQLQEDVDEICKPYGLYLEFGYSYSIVLLPL